ncbi:cytochrome P450 [Streptomyces sp. NPDC015144]|uniref:cytochrome P450 n=1 Tax=Streptomyces sp. NPDC015144 TaxID=3364944 RepID=UPI0036F50A81
MPEAVQKDEAAAQAPKELEERIRRWSVFQPWLQEDPIPFWKELREHGPIVRSEEFGGFWIFTRLEDIEWAAHHPDIFSSNEPTIPYRTMFRHKRIPIELDGVEHTEWRRTLDAVFSTSFVDHFTPQIAEAAAGLVDAIVARGRTELIDEYAFKLPAESFLITFGVGREKLPELLERRDWVQRNWLNATSDEELFDAAAPLHDFIRASVERRRAEGTAGRHDVISRLLESTHDGRTPTDDELVNALVDSMMASLDITNAMLGLAFLQLAERPELQARVAGATPDKLPAIVGELARHEPVMSTARVLTQDIERHGITLHKGERVFLSWGMAGLDPEVFENPDEIDFDRPQERVPSFGIGAHRCLGENLARRIFAVALREWHARIPEYHVTEGTSPTHFYSGLRRLGSLDISFG